MKSIKLLFAIAASLALAVALTACSSTASGPATTTATAATVNGIAIPEQEISDVINAMRGASPEYATPEAWATVLKSQNLTPDSLRKSIIDTKASTILVANEAKNIGLTADPARVEEKLAQSKTSVGGDEANWLAQLNKSGYATEQDYRDGLIVDDLAEQLLATYTIELSDEDLDAYVVKNVAAYIESNPDAAAGYKVPKKGVVVADVPVSLATAMRKQLEAEKRQDKLKEWVEGAVAAADIQINDMPADVPYNVDMTLAGAAEALVPKSTADQVAVAEAAGLVTSDTVVGKGAKVKEGDTVKVLYTGKFEDGTVFDSTDTTGEPIEFALSGVIKGWGEGLVGMKVGGKRHLIIPPSLGYGSSDYQSIPANSVLIFDVELVGITPAK